MTVIIENLQDKVQINDELNDLINKAVELSLQEEGFSTPCEISIMLVDDDRIREINREQRSMDKATDVLSFPIVDMVEGEMQSNEGDFDLDENLLLLGDIIISLEMAQKQAEEYGHSFLREIIFLLTHGVFHLLGYDHENEEAERQMFGKQEAVLLKMDLTRENY